MNDTMTTLRDPRAENAIAQIVMAYGDGGWLPLGVRHGIAVEVLTRLRSLGYAHPAVLDADREAEFRWHEWNGPVIDDDRYMPVTIARRLAAVATTDADQSETDHRRVELEAAWDAMTLSEGEVADRLAALADLQRAVTAALRSLDNAVAGPAVPTREFLRAALEASCQHPEQPPRDRGCIYCQAEPGQWCEYDCGSRSAAIAPEFRGDLDDDQAAER